MTTRPVLRALAALVLIGASVNAQARDGVAGELAAGAGRWIAAQGNAVLAQLQDDLRQHLHDQIQPFLPDDGALQKVSTESTAEPQQSL